MSLESPSTSPHPSYTRYGTPRRRRGRAWPRALLVVLAVTAVAAAAIVVAAADYATSRGEIHRGITVNGVEVGGLTARQAAAKLAAAAPNDGRVELTVEDKTWVVETATVGARLDADEAARAAYDYTRRSGLVVDAWRRLSLWLSSTDLGPSVLFDRESLRRELDKIAAKVDVKPVSATVRITGRQPSVKASKDGLGGARGAARASSRRPSSRTARSRGSSPSQSRTRPCRPLMRRPPPIRPRPT